jgi:hypothetical protein
MSVYFPNQNIQQHEINNARTLFHVEHMTVTAGAENIHLGLPACTRHISKARWRIFGVIA